MLTRRVITGAAAGTCLAGEARASALPRVASLNPCLDTILVHLADRAQIAALSHYARDPQSSTIAQQARALPFTYESAEEIVALRPDLVLASVHSSLATRQALARLNIEIATFGVPNSVEESIAQITSVADRIGQSARGRELAERIQTAIAQSERGATRRPIQALIFQPTGLVAGAGTLVNEVMTRLGFENVAARYGITFWGNARLENLLADPPELLLSGRVGDGAPTWAERLVTHPALARISHQMRRAAFPEACLYCGGPVLLETTRALTAAREAFWSAA
jgi:iron complex transport system substrate-binding protein